MNPFPFMSAMIVREPTSPCADDRAAEGEVTESVGVHSRGYEGEGAGMGDRQMNARPPTRIPATNDHRSPITEMTNLNAKRSALNAPPTLDAQRLTLSAPSPLPGTVIASYITYKGKKLGPYYIRTWFEHGKKRREYVKKKDLARVRAACQAHHEQKIRGRQIASELTTTLGNLNWLDRMANDSTKAPSARKTTPSSSKSNGTASPPPAAPASSDSQHPTRHSPHFLWTTFFKNPTDQFWEESFLDAERIANAYFARETETHEDKWKRWRESMEKKPKPRPLPLLTPPNWVDKKEVTAAVLEIIKERKESSPGGTTGGSTQRGMGVQGSSSNSEAPAKIEDKGKRGATKPSTHPQLPRELPNAARLEEGRRRDGVSVSKSERKRTTPIRNDIKETPRHQPGEVQQAACPDEGRRRDGVSIAARRTPTQLINPASNDVPFAEQLRRFQEVRE